MKIFITGGTGFVGRHLTTRLIKLGHQVYLLVRNKNQTDDLKNSGAIIQGGDLSTPESYAQIFSNSIEVVYHLAAISGMSWGKKEEDYYKDNVKNTKELLKVCSGKIKKFIYISSISAISNNNFKNDPYGKSKWQAEQQVLECQRQGLNTIILRPAIIYGPGDRGGVILRFIKLINQHKFYLVGSGKNHLAFVYIDDLIDGLVKALDYLKSGQIFELPGADLLTFEETGKILCEQLGVTLPKLKIPKEFAYFAAWLFELKAKLLKQSPIISRSSITALIRNHNFSFIKAQRELGYNPQTLFTQGLIKTINWYKENNYLNF